MALDVMKLDSRGAYIIECLPRSEPSSWQPLGDIYYEADRYATLDSCRLRWGHSHLFRIVGSGESRRPVVSV